MKSFAKRIKKIDLAKIVTSKISKVGIFGDATYEDGTPVSTVAIINEFGSPSAGIPERSFIRSTVREKGSEWASLAKDELKDVLKLKKTISKSMSILSNKALEDVKQKIITLDSPENADSTVKKKGFNNPLVDTGKMLESITVRNVK